MHEFPRGWQIRAFVVSIRGRPCPPLAIGAYKLAVRASYSGSEDLDVGFLDYVLQVAPPELLLEGPAPDFDPPSMRLLEIGRDAHAVHDPDADSEP